jgi:hypothetical protein
MNSNALSLTPIQTEITSTAFRLPTRLLRMIDKWCDDNDLTRSQFFRHCITDRVKSLGIATPTELNADQLQPPGVNSAIATGKEKPRQWSPETYARFERRR